MCQFATIGVIRCCFREKFGIPRQRAVPAAGPLWNCCRHTISRRRCAAGGFSHLWLVFVFHGVPLALAATVRRRVGRQPAAGVFATRSPSGLIDRSVSGKTGHIAVRQGQVCCI